MKPTDLDGFRILSQPRLHPTWDHVVFGVARPNLKKDRYDASLWISDPGGVRELPAASECRVPEWSPDGCMLAVIKPVPDDPEAPDGAKTAQLAVLDAPLAASAPRVLTSFSAGVTRFRWSPGGDRIAVLADEYAGEWADLSAKDRAKQPRRITSVPWRIDATKTFDDRRPVLALVDPSGQTAPVRVDVGENVDIEGLAWHPTSGTLALILGRVHKTRLRGEQVVVTVNPETGDVHEVNRGGFWADIHYVGERLIAVGLADEFAWPAPFSLHELKDSGVFPIAGPDRIIDASRAVGESVVCLIADQGRSRLVRWKPDTWTDLDHDTPFISDFDVRPDGARAIIAGGPCDPGELVRVEGGRAEIRTQLNADFRRDAELIAPEHFVVATADGVEVDTWVLMPPGDGPVPVLLNIHGGPAAQYGFGFFDEFQVYAAAGYGVVACNPRGSCGRGKEHLRAVRNEGWGEVDDHDVIACLDEALKRFPRLDPKRQGIMGGSYGGFMTAWLIARHDRFKSAVVERGLVDWVAFSGNSDIAAIFADMYFDDPTAERLAALSPQNLAGKVKTPTLIIHSEQDWRCPIDQAERYFHALLRNGVESEFLRFPGESHELTRSGNPVHRKQRFEAILEWHGRFLGED